MDYLNIMVSNAEYFADSGFLSREDLKGRILEIFDRYPSIDGSSISFEPNAFDGKDSLYINTEYGTSINGWASYYFLMQNGKTVFSSGMEENEEEYIRDYYTLPVKKRGMTITEEPYIYEFKGFL
ncbi:MAG: hypothetical protein LBU32_11370 [Clostridiales bacterium]|jgi:methyl-accepting chemotaxis protein|nr:hypothetical protein [Clostridiales bacterium]